MRITKEEIVLLLTAIDDNLSGIDENDLFRKPYEKLIIKLSKELKRRGYSTIISEGWLQNENPRVQE